MYTYIHRVTVTTCMLACKQALGGAVYSCTVACYGCLRAMCTCVVNSCTVACYGQAIVVFAVVVVALG